MCDKQIGYTDKSWQCRFLPPGNKLQWIGNPLSRRFQIVGLIQNIKK